jgi:hypothetical protein
MGCFTPFTYTIFPRQLWYHTSLAIKPHSCLSHVLLTSRSSIVHILLEIYAYMQACTLYGAGKLEGMQQAVHIQQLLHMSPRDLKCLFDRVEMKHQLHLTILLPIAIDCRQRIKIEPIADLIAKVQTAIGQQHTRKGHSPLYGDDRIKVSISLAGGGGGSKLSVCMVCSHRVRLMKSCNTFCRPDRLLIYTTNTPA